MKKRNKALLLVMCAVILVVGSIMGTIAYLTDTETVTNTFTVGNVTLGDGASEKGLDEALVNEYGQPIDSDTNKNVVDRTKAPRVQGNDYKLIPGHTYTKDPTVHVKNDSEDCYVFVKIANGIADIEAAAGGTDNYQQIATQITTENGWTALTGVDNVYWKKWEQPIDTTGTTDWIVFSRFKIDGDKVVSVAEGETVPTGKYNISSYASKQVVVTAYAIQADGFNSATEAWTGGGFESN